VHVPQQSAITLLAPGLQPMAHEVIRLMEADGHDPLLFETGRTRERVFFLYGKGRTAAQCEAAGVPRVWAWPDCPDGIVTKANRLEDTVHAYGLAFDVISRKRRWAASPAFWESLRLACARVGLFWAGRWPTLPDKPHCQIGAWTRGPSVRARQLLRANDIPQLWHDLGVAA
jgi:hypothetical protein